MIAASPSNVSMRKLHSRSPISSVAMSGAGWSGSNTALEIVLVWSDTIATLVTFAVPNDWLGGSDTLLDDM